MLVFLLICFARITPAYITKENHLFVLNSCKKKTKEENIITKQWKKGARKNILINAIFAQNKQHYKAKALDKTQQKTPTSNTISLPLPAATIS